MEIENAFIKLYIEKMIQLDADKVKEFINENLHEEERFIKFANLLDVIAKGKIQIPIPTNYSNKVEIMLSDKVLHLSTIQTSSLPVEGTGETVTIFVSYILTEQYEVVLVKCLASEDEMVYYTMELHLYEDHVLPAEEHFFITMLPEFLQLAQSGDYVEELYAVKKEVYQQAIRFYMHYSRQHDEAVFTNWLASQNISEDQYHIEKGKKFMINVKYGNDTKTVKFVECSMRPLGDKYRTRYAPVANEGVSAIIIKVKEPGRLNKCHYIFVSNVENEIKYTKKKRLNVSALFSKADIGYELEKDLPRDSLLTYDYLHEAKF